MTRKPITRQAAIANRILLVVATLGLVFDLVVDRPYDWEDGVSLALGAVVVIACLVVEGQARRDRRDGRV